MQIIIYLLLKIMILIQVPGVEDILEEDMLKHKQKEEDAEEEMRKKKEEEEKAIELKKQQDRARPVSSTPVPGKMIVNIFVF